MDDSYPETSVEELWDYQPLPSPVPITDQKWPVGTRPLVSICCITYNHVNFIRDAIEGFLMQETTFPVEILIHDDASTDGTAEIIAEYAERYDGLIRITLQTKNQYSLGKKVLNIALLRSKGSFAAICHGDDYWTDRYKLIKQVSVMKAEAVDISGHRAHVESAVSGDRNKVTGYYVPRATKFPATVLIKNNANMLPFGSIMLTKRAKEAILSNMPPVEFHTGIQLLGAMYTGLAVLPDPMMVYRVDVPGSTTELLLSSSKRTAETTARRIRSFRAVMRLYEPEDKLRLQKLIVRQANVWNYRKDLGAMAPIFKALFSSEKFYIKLVLSFHILFFNAAYLIRILGGKLRLFASRSFILNSRP